MASSPAPTVSGWSCCLPSHRAAYSWGCVGVRQRPAAHLHDVSPTAHPLGCIAVLLWCRPLLAPAPTVCRRSPPFPSLPSLLAHPVPNIPSLLAHPVPNPPSPLPTPSPPSPARRGPRSSGRAGADAGARGAFLLPARQAHRRHAGARRCASLLWSGEQCGAMCACAASLRSAALCVPHHLVLPACPAQRRNAVGRGGKRSSQAVPARRWFAPFPLG